MFEQALVQNAFDWRMDFVDYSKQTYIAMVTVAHADAAVGSTFLLNVLFLAVFFFGFITETHFAEMHSSALQKKNVGLGLRAVDLEISTAHDIFWPSNLASQIVPGKNPEWDPC